MITVSSLEIKNWILHFSSLGLKARNSVSGKPDTDCVFLTLSGFIPAGMAQHPRFFLSLRDFLPIFDFFGVSQVFIFPTNGCLL